MFLANYSDGLSDVDLPAMIETFRKSGKIACFLAVRPSFSLHLVEMEASGTVNGLRATRTPTSGSMAASSSSARRSSTICARVRSWSKHRSAGSSRPISCSPSGTRASGARWTP